MRSRARRLLLTNTHALIQRFTSAPWSGRALPSDAAGLLGYDGIVLSDVSNDAQAFATSLGAPYCGVNSGFEAASWLPDPAMAMSIALIPLRADPAQEAFGMLVLASTDAQRFHADMGTDFLAQIGDLADAALSRLLPVASSE